jgi:aspartate aminotransferase/aminotransferase
MPTFSRVAQMANEAMSIKYNNLVYEMKKSGRDLIVLSLGEAFFDLSLADFRELPVPDIYHYSHSRGLPELRRLIADYYANEYDVSVNPDSEILITAGSKAAIHFVIMSTLNPADEALIHEPLWVSYPEQVKLAYGVPIQIPLDVPVSDFENYVSPRSKLLIVNNPSNPRGSVLTDDEMSMLLDTARRHNLLLLSDEAYSEFLVDRRFRSFGKLDLDKHHVAICNSISKNFGLSGWRIGYVIAHADLISQVLKINQHLITCPPTILQHYLVKHFETILRITRPQIRAVVEKRRAVADYVSSLGLHQLDGDATFYIFLSTQPSMLRSEAFCDRLLAEEGICVVPGIGYGESCDRFVRISVGTESIERIHLALDRIKRFIQATR